MARCHVPTRVAGWRRRRAGRIGLQLAGARFATLPSLPLEPGAATKPGDRRAGVFPKAGDIVHEHFLKSRVTRPLLRAVLCGMVILAGGCVRWESVPVADVGAGGLPRWVEVTTRDSVHHTLEGARLLPGDTIVGRSADAAPDAPPVRIPVSEIVRLEARLPSGVGSIGVGALILVGLAGLVALIGHASTL